MVSLKSLIVTLMLIVTAVNRCECGVYSIIRDLLQWNLVGPPVFHQRTEWDFNPEVSQQRREQFYELHGFRSARYLERIGEGIDGRHRERQYYQAVRDDGNLQGVNQLRP